MNKKDRRPKCVGIMLALIFVLLNSFSWRQILCGLLANRAASESGPGEVREFLGY